MLLGQSLSGHKYNAKNGHYLQRIITGKARCTAVEKEHVSTCIFHRIVELLT